MSSYESIDFFTDPSLIPDPHPYFDYLRRQSPVLRLPQYGVVAVTGYEEATAVYKDTDSFSNCVALGGPFRRCPSHPTVTTSTPRSTPIANSFRCTSTWSPWTHRSTVGRGRF